MGVLEYFTVGDQGGARGGAHNWVILRLEVGLLTLGAWDLTHGVGFQVLNFRGKKGIRGGLQNPDHPVRVVLREPGQGFEFVGDIRRGRFLAVVFEFHTGFFPDHRFVK